MVRLAAVRPAALSPVPDRLARSAAHGRLLAASTELFAARGYHGVSVRDIATFLGVKPSTLYAHYASKDELYADLVLLANEEIDTRLREAVLVADPAPAATLAALVRAYVQFHADFPLLGSIGHNDLHVLAPAQLRAVTQLRKQHISLFLSVIERGNETGDFSCRQPWLAVAAIAGMGIRVALWYRAPDEAAASSADSYAAAMEEWVPRFSVEDLAAEYVDYALALVHSSG
ncbi:MAG: Transcriptional regulator, TetR family [Frankiales bacterium]|nr:Transcriptional regulator, TetR family [Frankiales bacterium]